MAGLGASEGGEEESCGGGGEGGCEEDVRGEICSEETN